MAEPCIICAAMTGSVPQNADNPAVPITVAVQAESAQQALEAGSSIVRVHVRADDGTPTASERRS